MSASVQPKRREFCSIALEKRGKNSQITRNSSPTPSRHHVFVDVGVNCRGINASQNRIVCLCRPPSFFFSTSLGRMGFSWQTDILVRPSLICRTKPHPRLTLKHAHSGPVQTQPECLPISNFAHAFNQQPEQQGRYALISIHSQSSSLCFSL